MRFIKQKPTDNARLALHVVNLEEVQFRLPVCPTSANIALAT